MKRMRNILFLGGILCSLIIFWLIPSLYSAPPTTYHRLYEDTYGLQTATDSTRKQRHEADKERKKIYKEEQLSSRRKVKSLNAKMFSRSAQYFPKDELIVTMDTFNVEVVDTLQVEEEAMTLLEVEGDSTHIASKKQ